MTGIAAPLPKMPRSVLFMCGMNAIRSPMAEALARAALPKGTYVASAGCGTASAIRSSTSFSRRSGSRSVAISRARSTNLKTIT